MIDDSLFSTGCWISQDLSGKKFGYDGTFDSALYINSGFLTLDQHWRETEIYNATRGDRSGQMRIAFRRFVSRKLRYKLSIRSVPPFPSLRSYLKSACHEYCPFHYCHKKKFFSKPDLHLFRSDPSISILPLFSRSITTVKCANYRSPFLQFLYQFVSIDPHLSILLDRILIRERRMIHGVASLPGSRIHREQKKKKKKDSSTLLLALPPTLSQASSWKPIALLLVATRGPLSLPLLFASLIKNSHGLSGNFNQSATRAEFGIISLASRETRSVPFLDVWCLSCVIVRPRIGSCRHFIRVKS